MLKKITILRERVVDWESYPFSTAAIRGLDELSISLKDLFFHRRERHRKITVLNRLSALRKYPAPVRLSKDSRSARTRASTGVIALGTVVLEIAIATPPDRSRNEPQSPPEASSRT